jgi:hypothetical protein
LLSYPPEDRYGALLLLWELEARRQRIAQGWRETEPNLLVATIRAACDIIVALSLGEGIDAVKTKSSLRSPCKGLEKSRQTRKALKRRLKGLNDMLELPVLILLIEG